MYSCGRCGKRSANPTDKAEGYCGECHAFTGDQRVRLGRLPMLTMVELRDLHVIICDRIAASTRPAHSEQAPLRNEMAADSVATLRSLRTAVAEAMAHAIAADPGEALVLVADLQRVLETMTLRSPGRAVSAFDIFAQPLGAMKATVLRYIAAENLAEIGPDPANLEVRPPRD